MNTRTSADTRRKLFEDNKHKLDRLVRKALSEWAKYMRYILVGYDPNDESVADVFDMAPHNPYWAEEGIFARNFEVMRSILPNSFFVDDLMYNTSGVDDRHTDMHGINIFLPVIRELDAFQKKYEPEGYDPRQDFDSLRLTKTGEYFIRKAVEMFEPWRERIASAMSEEAERRKKATMKIANLFLRIAKVAKKPTGDCSIAYPVGREKRKIECRMI